MEFKTEKEILLNAIAKADELGLLGDTDEIVERVANGENTENQGDSVLTVKKDDCQSMKRN